MTRITLNLLPPDRRDSLHAGYLLASAQALLRVAFITSVAVAGTLAAVSFLVRGTAQEFAARSITSSQEQEKLTAEVRAINGYLKRVDGYSDGIAWSQVLRAVSELAPSGVRLTSIHATADGKITVSGVADTRDEMLAMRDALEASPSFEQVSSPISNILQQRDVRFEFALQYVPAAAPVTP